LVLDPNASPLSFSLAIGKKTASQSALNPRRRAMLTIFNGFAFSFPPSSSSHPPQRRRRSVVFLPALFSRSPRLLVEVGSLTRFDRPVRNSPFKVARYFSAPNSSPFCRFLLLLLSFFPLVLFYLSPDSNRPFFFALPNFS